MPRNSYWSCGPVADWIRGSVKPHAATGADWAQWHDHAKQQHPVRYWVAETLLDKLQNMIFWPMDRLYDIKYYVNNRWVTRTHSLTAHARDIRPGQWRDVGDRFLPCLFNELVDFVEIELAWWHIAWGGAAERKQYGAPFWATGWFRWRTWRCAQAGLDNLSWQINLINDENSGFSPDDTGYGQPTTQAHNAKEILALYKWWTEVYRNRSDPYDDSGWSAHCAIMREKAQTEGHTPAARFNSFLDSQDPEDHNRSSTALQKLQSLEDQYLQEDTDMLIRLIKIRGSLWT